MTNEAVARTRPASRTRDTLRPTLHLIEGKIPQRSVIPLALLAIAILLAAIVVPLVVNTQMAETAFEIRERGPCRRNCTTHRHLRPSKNLHAILVWFRQDPPGSSRCRTAPSRAARPLFVVNNAQLERLTR